MLKQNNTTTKPLNQNRMKQTAVEWLIQEWPILEAQLPQWLIEQVKEMEMDQNKYSFEHGFYFGRFTDGNRLDAWNHYKENLKSK